MVNVGLRSAISEPIGQVEGPGYLQYITNNFLDPLSDDCELNVINAIMAPDSFASQLYISQSELVLRWLKQDPIVRIDQLCTRL